MANSKVTDANKIQLIIGGNVITGWEKGDFITYSYPQSMSTSVDAHGNTYFIVNNDKTVTLTLKLSASAESNNVLSRYMNLNAIVPAEFKDFSSDTIVTSLESFVTIEDGTLGSNSERTISWTLTMTKASLIINGIKRG